MCEHICIVVVPQDGIIYYLRYLCLQMKDIINN